MNHDPWAVEVATRWGDRLNRARQDLPTERSGLQGYNDIDAALLRRKLREVETLATDMKRELDEHEQAAKDERITNLLTQAIKQAFAKGGS